MTKEELVWISDNDLGENFTKGQHYISIKRYGDKWILIKNDNKTSFDTRAEALRSITTRESVAIVIEDTHGDLRYLITLSDLNLVNGTSCFDKGYKIEDDKLFDAIISIFNGDKKHISTQIAIYPKKSNQNYWVA